MRLPSSNDDDDDDAELHPPHESPIGFLSGHWLPHDHLRLSVDDVGFRQGVTVVERLRTYQGRIFAVEAHLCRWKWSALRLGIAALPSAETIEGLLLELLQRNAAFVQSEGEVGITMFATPGVLGKTEPTFGLHLNRLPLERIQRFREQGQAIVVTDVQQPSPECWPRSIKTRSRVHYYLADAFAAQHSPDSLGVLLDEDGSITETSTSNLAILRDQVIISPPADRVLAGVTQLFIEQLAQDASLTWIKRPIDPTELVEADEVILMGTDGGIWFAPAVSHHPIGGGTPGNVYLKLRERFDRLVNATE